MRRTLIIISALVVLLGLGVLAYFTLFAEKPKLEVTPSPTLPIGDGTTPPGSIPPPAPDIVPQNPYPTEPVAARLSKISAGPVVPGAVVVDIKYPQTASSTPEEGGTQTFFIERQSGNVFSYTTRTGVLNRTSNRTVPGIQEAYWLSDASLAVVRYLSGTDFNTVNTYSLPADGSSGSFLSQNLAGVAVASSSVLVIASGANGSVGTVEQADGSRAVTVFTTPLASIRASFAGKNQYLVFTKPAASEDGFAFLVDAKGSFSRIAGPLKGLSALASPSGKWVLVSSVDSGGTAMKMMLVNSATRENIALPVGTIADKCVWTQDETAIYCGIPVSPPRATYPDDWLQGAVHFGDRIWKIDVAGRFAQLTLDFTNEIKAPLDATALALDPRGRVLVFLNKNDGSLWSYSL